MQGNPVKSKDLHKAGIKKAKAVIILSKSTSDIEQSEMVDADTIFIYKAIKNETKSTMIIAELVSVSALSFLNSNSGISSRIGYTLEFEDYTTEELISIFDGMVKKSGFEVTNEAHDKLRTIIEENRNSENFGNARFARSLYEKTVILHAIRKI